MENIKSKRHNVTMSQRHNVTTSQRHNITTSQHHSVQILKDKHISAVKRDFSSKTTKNEMTAALSIFTAAVKTVLDPVPAVPDGDHRSEEKPIIVSVRIFTFHQCRECKTLPF